jgi:hypothetical protein
MLLLEVRITLIALVNQFIIKKLITMCTTNQKYANTGLINVSVANPNLDGTGTLGTVLTSPTTASNNGTKINTVTIKATGNTSQGMVRLFTFDGTTYFLWKEIMIPANTQSATIEAFQTTIVEELILDPGQILLASTQNAESFNIYANGINWTNCECSETCSCGDQQVVAHSGLGNVFVANSNLNGTGSITTILTAPSGSLVYGSIIPFIDVKATATNAEGMIRIFIDNGTTKYLIWEIPIPATTATATQPSYRTKTIAMIDLQPGYSLCASTQNANSFNIIMLASDITNCPCA